MDRKTIEDPKPKREIEEKNLKDSLSRKKGIS